MRKLIWGEEKAFKGIKCSECGWLVPNPSMDAQNRTEEEWRAEIQRRFEDHKCEKHPLKPKEVKR